MRCAFALGVLSCAALVSTCGGRTPLSAGQAEDGAAGSPAAPVACTVDAQCGTPDSCGAPICVANECTIVPVLCDDANPCTADSCDPLSGCVFRSLVQDADQDGHWSSIPGGPVAPSGCASDCNDQDARAFPGAPERCDAVDNDCNGVVDDGAVYQPSVGGPVRFSDPDSPRANSAGLTATPARFVASYGPQRGGRWDSALSFLRSSGMPESELSVTSVNADTYAGPVVFNGSVLATAWEDARQDGNYEIYFARFGAQGAKLGPDVRLTDAPRFSLHPQLLWTGTEYLVVWDDRRAEELGAGEFPRVYAQRVSEAGEPIGPNRPLAPEDRVSEFPELAFAGERMALVYVAGAESRVVFKLFDRKLTPLGQPSRSGENVHLPSVHWVGGRYVVLFTTYASAPGNALWGATYDADGRPLLEPRPIASGGRHARSHDAVSLGDRLLVVWADDLHGNYDLFSQVVDAELRVIAGRQRLTSDAGDEIGPAVSLGPSGTVGVVFTGHLASRHAAYLLTLGCQP